MTEFYHSVLFATDFSETSGEAGRRALCQAKANSARLCMVHVLEHFPVELPVDWVAPEDVDPTTYYSDRAKQELTSLASDLGCPDAEQEVVVSGGSAGHAIAEFARQHDVDLIVAGVHGGWVAALGSTAMSISHQAPCDVLLVR